MALGPIHHYERPATGDPSASARESIAVFLLALGSAWAAGNVGPVASELGAEFDVSLATVGLLSGTLFFGASVAGILVSPALGERLGVIRSLQLACLLGILGHLVFAASPWFAGLGVGRVLAGLNLGLVPVLGPVFAGQAGGVRLIGLFGASIQLGIAGALGVGSVLSDLGVDWRVGFVISAALAASALPFLRTGEVTAVPQRHRPGFLRAVIRSLQVYRLALMFMAAYSVPLITGAWLVEYLTEPGGVRAGVAGALSFLLFGLSAVARLTGARLEARGVPSTALSAGMALAAVGMALLAVDRTFPLVLVAVVALGIGFAIPYGAMIVNAQRLFPSEPAEPLALLTLVAIAIPIIVIPVVGDALGAGNGEAALLVLAAFLAVATVANLKPVGRPVTAGDSA